MIQRLATGSMKFSPRLYMELMARTVGQGPLIGEEIGQAIKTLDALQLELFRYTGDGCLITLRVNGEDFQYCGKPCFSRNHTIQHNGVLDLIAEPSCSNPNDLKVYGMVPDVETVRNLTASTDPDTGRRGSVGQYPLWKIAEFKPRKISIANAAVDWFACGECDNSVFDLIDKPPVLRGHNLPLSLDEACAKWWLYRLGDEQETCLEHWSFLLAYRSFLLRLNRFSGLLSAILASRREQAGRQLAITVDILDSLHRRIQTQIDRLLVYRRWFESKRLGKQNHAMHHIVLELSPALPVASSDFIPVRDFQGRWAYVAVNIYPQPHRFLVFVSYFVADRPIVSRAVKALTHGVEREIPTRTGVWLSQVLGEWDNVYVHPADYDALDPAYLRTIQRARSEPAIGMGFGSMFDLIETTAAGKRALERIRRGPLSLIYDGDGNPVNVDKLRRLRLRPSLYGT